MNFFNQKINLNKLENTVFAVLEKYHQDSNPNKINATIGSLCDENNKLVSFNSVMQAFRNLSDFDYSKYPQDIIGNRDFIQKIQEYTFKNLITLASKTVATTGGTGAIYLAFKTYLDANDTILIPEICWDSYYVMIDEFNLKYQTYPIFDFEIFKKVATDIIVKQNKLVLLINDPAHNPTGISLGYSMWIKIIEFLNQFDVPIIIIHDLAYLDYCENREFFKAYNLAQKHILIHTAISLSKGFTLYGQRIGACSVFNQDEMLVEKCLDLFEKTLRSTVSCSNNAAMKCYVDVLNHHLKEYQQELKKYCQLLKKRSDLIISKVDEEFTIYPYNDGFFVTLKLKDNKTRDRLFDELINKHIYLVKVNCGLRIAVCSLALKQIENLVKTIKETKKELNI